MTATASISTNVQPGGATVRHSTAIDFELRDDSMIASVSHELRVPLANLKMRLYLARMQPEKAKDHLQVMEAITDRMCTLVDDLLDTATLELGTLQLNRQHI